MGAEATDGTWAAARREVHGALPSLRRSLAGEERSAVTAYLEAVEAWCKALPEVGGTQASLQIPQRLRDFAKKLPTQPPCLRAAHKAFVDAVARARALVRVAPAPGFRVSVPTECTLSAMVRAAAPATDRLTPRPYAGAGPCATLHAAVLR